MGKLKATKLLLILCIIFMIIAIIPVVVADEYDYSSIDLTKHENQVALDGDIEFDIYEKSNGDNAIEFDFEIFNLTDKTLNDVVVYIHLQNSDGEEEVFYSETMSLESRDSVEKELVGDCDEEEYFGIEVYAQIGDGEIFAVSQLDELVKDNPVVSVSAIIFTVFLIAVIILSVRVGKASNKRLEIENEAYAKKVNDMIDLDIERETVMIERDRVTNEILRQNQQNKTEEPKRVKCEYCGNVNDADAERCSVCGALLNK